MKISRIIALLLLLTALLAACDSVADGNEKTIFVGPELVDCVGVAPQQCLQVREDPAADYTLFYDQIEGFTFEEGYDYELVIREEQVENPPADASSIRWVLVEEVSKTPAAPAEAAGEETTAGEESPAEMPAPGTQNLLTIQVGPEMVDCVGVAPQQCLLVKAPDDAEYSLFYDTIEGFEYEPGFEYVLVVSVENVADAPADAPARKVSLVEVVHKLPVEGTAGSGSEPLPPNPLWVLESYRGADGSMVAALPDVQVTAQFAEDRVAGNAGCNSYTGAAVVDGANLTIDEIARTLALCQPEAIMQQEDAFINLLSTAATFEVKGAQMILRDAEDNDVLIFGFSESDVKTLENSYWVMTSYNNGRDAVQGALESVEVTAEFADGQVTGTAGCNRYFGGFEMDGNNIVFGPLGSTAMFCAEPDGVMDQETAFLAALQNSTTYQITGDMLEFFAADGSRQATFAAAEKAAFTLENTYWVMTAYNNGRDAVQGALEGVEVTAEFADGQVTGTAGCNRYFGGFEMDGNNIVFGPLGSTQMFCAEPDGVMDQEAAYLAALQNSTTYQITGDMLEFFAADGSRQATFTASEKAGFTLENTLWIMNSYNNGQGGVQSAAIDTEATALFQDGQLSGNASCNQYFGAYELDGNNIAIGALGSTQMFCVEPDGIMDQEAAFLAALQNSTTYEIVGNQLDFYAADGSRQAIFFASEEAAAATLVGPVWNLSTFHSGDTVSSIIVGSEINAQFGEDAQAVGSAGCNRYFGSFITEGESLTIGPLGATRMACADPAGVMEQETKYLALLDAAAGYTIEGDTLTLIDAQGRPLLTYVVAE